MKNKQSYLRYASFAALFFVILGYTVKFYPETLAGFDKGLQVAFRGQLPEAATLFWSHITILGNASVTILLTLGLASLFYWKKWKAEAYFLVLNFALMGFFSTLLKYVYQRPRPTIEWLVNTTGYSYPSWHTASTLLIAGFLVIILQQRMKADALRLLSQIGLVLVAILVALSRIYIGVHFPTDIIGGWLLAVTILLAVFPYYDQYRFTQRFQSKQK